jgi:hypothetical protein
MILNIAKWNFDRNNTNFFRDLEESMLQEEALEFKDGLKAYWEATSEKEKQLATVDMVDAYCDFIFVLYGTEYKMLGADVAIDLSRYHNQANYMSKCLEALGIEYRTLNIALDLVMKANNEKGTEKVNGKIQKGAGWYDPKVKIFELMYGEVL